VFNVTFICMYQHLLLLLIVLPSYVAQRAGAAAPLTVVDAAATAIFLALLVLESAADQQQWVFQQSKRGLLPKRCALRRFVASLAPLPHFRTLVRCADESRFASCTRRCSNRRPELAADYARGFLTGGLFGWSRHPNFFAEQSMWWAYYLFAVAAAAGATSPIPTAAWLQPCLVGPVLLSALFQGSTPFTETITARKYPGACIVCAVLHRARMLLLPHIRLASHASLAHSASVALWLWGVRSVQGVPAQGVAPHSAANQRKDGLSAEAQINTAALWTRVLACALARCADAWGKSVEKFTQYENKTHKARRRDARLRLISIRRRARALGGAVHSPAARSGQRPTRGLRVGVPRLCSASARGTWQPPAAACGARAPQGACMPARRRPQQQQQLIFTPSRFPCPHSPSQHSRKLRSAAQRAAYAFTSSDLPSAIAFTPYAILSATPAFARAILVVTCLMPPAIWPISCFFVGSDSSLEMSAGLTNLPSITPPFQVSSMPRAFFTALAMSLNALMLLRAK
jgi:steroid 5-alpha reductase family enzyme